MTRSRVSLAALSVAYLSPSLLPLARANTAYTGTDPIVNKFALSIGADAAGPGAATNDHAPDADKAKTAIHEMLGTDTAAQLQAANPGGTVQADAIETGAKTVGDPPAGSDQQQ